jgi:hypothetical protein
MSDTGKAKLTFGDEAGLMTEDKPQLTTKSEMDTEILKIGELHRRIRETESLDGRRGNR